MTQHERGMIFRLIWRKVTRDKVLIREKAVLRFIDMKESPQGE